MASSVFFFVDKNPLLIHKTYCNSEKRLYNAIYSNENKADVTSIRL